MGKTEGLIPTLKEFLHAYDTNLDGSKKSTEVLLDRFDRVQSSMDFLWDRINDISMQHMNGTVYAFRIWHSSG